MESKTSAKDFFLHLGAIVALYTVVISFLNLVFKIINKAFPEVANYNYYFSGGSEISMPVATLIIVFPIFVLLSWLVYKTYVSDPTKKSLAVRKWLTYITLFVAGIILVGDLVTVLYKFLDGQDLTAAFLLKALAVLVVAGFVFGFYLQDIRDRVSSKQRKVWAIVAGVVVLLAIILGFKVLGSPANQRMLREDNQKVMDLQSMQWEVINSWQQAGTLPETFSSMEITNPFKGAEEIAELYEYKKTGPINYELCATFNKESMMQNRGGMMTYPTKGIPQSESWDHGAGHHCFARTIDTISYPVINR